MWALSGSAARRSADRKFGERSYPRVARTSFISIKGSSTRQFSGSAPTQAESPIGRSCRLPACAQIMFRHLDTGMAQKQLDLFEIGTAASAEHRTGPP